MAIQFFCPACRQPIEVDDDVAGQTVTCPYCQKVVTTPQQSDPAVRQSAPSARLPETPGLSTPPPPLPYAGAATGGSNKLGWASLICVVVCLLSLGAMMLLAASLLGGQTAPADPKEVQKRIMQAMSDRPALAVAYVAALVGSCGVPIVGAVLAIISLAARRAPRWPAIVSLSLLGLYMVLGCLNFLGALAGMQPPK